MKFKTAAVLLALCSFIASAFAGGGALVTTIGVPDRAVPNGTNFQFLAFGTVVYDTANIWNPAQPTRLTVPAGVSKVRLGGQMIWSPNNNGLRQCVIKKNYPSGGGWYAGVPATNVVAAGGTTTDLSCWTGVIPVSPGDFFEIEAYQNSGTTINVLASVGTWFAMEIIE